MKNILLFGAGKSATILIDYLLSNAEKDNWQLTIVDADINLAQSKIGISPFAKAVSFDINDEADRKKYIGGSDIVISLLPPALHAVVAKTCVELNKNLLTASYIDNEIRKLESEISTKKLLFLCEMGLDPGIDHMSAMKIFDKIHADGGKITSFKSHCGGLVAPESDDNPWHYKISWNPRNILLAGKSGANYREDGETRSLKYEELFTTGRLVEIPEIGYLCWYPNRDSLSYAPLYGLEDAKTIIRTTLRHPDFMYGWKNVIELKLTDETPVYETSGKAIMDFFKEHMDKNGFSDWLQKKLSERFDQTKDLLEKLMELVEAENEAEKSGGDVEKDFMVVGKEGDLQKMDLDKIKTDAAEIVAHKMHEANLTLKQLFFLGMDDDETMINKGICSAADVMEFVLQKKLALQPEDKDMIVMLHEIEYTVSGQKSKLNSSLVVRGENNLRTAMAKTVGLPLGIAAKLILNGTIKLTGLHIPTKKEIYEPVLKELEEYEIRFHEEIQ
ncbi:MAG TPA: saccharopine dehydrogenase C-terminal domain-containing protein [Chitinophagaceae bacterium]|nr:saccharopine dehydrogenase C-terminal domain-containing protein [Chitinophagaceae bacterium]